MVMHLSYGRYFDEDVITDLSYEECLHIVRGLEAFKKRHLRNGPVVEKVATFMQRNRVRNLAWLNQHIEDMASRELGGSKPSSGRLQHPRGSPLRIA